MIEKIRPDSLTDGLEPTADNQGPISRWKIGIMWAFMSLAVVALTASLTGSMLGILEYNFSAGLMAFMIPVGIAASILHPGGWLGLIGLGFALKRRNYRWFYLSGAGAIITGIVTAFFVAVGLGGVAV